MLPLGGEEVTNGDFETGDTTGWFFTDCTGDVGTYQGRNNVLKCTLTNTDTIYGYNNSAAPTTANKYYLYSMDVYLPSGQGISEINIRYSTTVTTKIASTNTTDSWVTLSAITSDAGGNFYAYTPDGDVDDVYYVDNVSVKEIEVLGDDLVTAGDMSDAGEWDLGTGWSIAGGVASCSGAQSADSDLTQGSLFASGDVILVKYTVSGYSASNVCVVGGTVESSDESANGTYEAIIISDGTDLSIRGDADFEGDIDNVSVHKLTVTKEIAGSTNYTGTHYVLPEQGEDLDSFIIPVDYAAEAIDAQKITGESNLTTGWTAANNAVITTEETNVNEGFAALEIESNTTPTASADADTDITVENGEVYRLSIDHRHIGSGDDWILEVEGATADTLDNTETTYATKVYYFTAGDTTCTIRYKENNASNDGGIYTDNISLKKVTFP